RWRPRFSPLEGAVNRIDRRNVLRRDRFRGVSSGRSGESASRCTYRYADRSHRRKDKDPELPSRPTSSLRRFPMLPAAMAPEPVSRFAPNFFFEQSIKLLDDRAMGNRFRVFDHFMERVLVV